MAGCSRENSVSWLRQMNLNMIDNFCSNESYKKLSNPWIVSLIGVLLAVGMTAIYLQNGPRIFDIWFFDETLYMSNGISITGPNMSSHEWGPLYSLYYRLLNIHISDPVDLYLLGGVILLAACALAIFSSLAILSRSIIFALLATAIFIRSNALITWPRVSFAAIVILAVGLSLMSLLRSWFARSATLMLTSFLLTFIRPEFELAFYIFLILTLTCAISEIHRAIRNGKYIDIFRSDVAIGVCAILTVLVLSVIWSFPLPRSGGRAFVAFSQHFSLRYVLESKSALDPWWNHREIVEPFFPGAKSIGEALRIAPATFAHFLLANALDLPARLYAYFRTALSIEEWRSLSERFMLAFLVAGLLTSVTEVFRNIRHPGNHVSFGNRAYITDGFFTLVLVVPPLLSCIVIYPRNHYIVLLFYLILVCCALSLRYLRWNNSSLVATILVGAGLIIWTPVLRAVPQPNVIDINSMRKIPDIKVMLEPDLGWCLYYLPHCKAVSLFKEGESFEKMLSDQNIDAIMMSPRLRGIEWLARQPAFQELDANPARFGFQAIPLPSGRILLVKQ